MISDDKILKGFRFKRPPLLDYFMAFLPIDSFWKFGSVRYAKAQIKPEKRQINVQVRVNFTGNEKYFDDCCQGIAGHWSRRIMLNGNQWTVKTTVEKHKKGLSITVQDKESESDKSTFRFRFPKSHITIINTHGLVWMKRTAAHEVGHAIITDSLGRKESSTHHGTSTTSNRILDTALPYPTQGEIDLMKYYPNTNTGRDFINRSIASENDVKALVYIASR